MANEILMCVLVLTCRVHCTLHLYLQYCTFQPRECNDCVHKFDYLSSFLSLCFTTPLCVVEWCTLYSNQASKKSPFLSSFLMPSFLSLVPAPLSRDLERIPQFGTPNGPPPHTCTGPPLTRAKRTKKGWYLWRYDIQFRHLLFNNVKQNCVLLFVKSESASFRACLCVGRGGANSEGRSWGAKEEMERVKSPSSSSSSSFVPFRLLHTSVNKNVRFSAVKDQ